MNILHTFGCSLYDHQINFIDIDAFGLMSWVKDNNFALDSDGMHPSTEVYKIFANTILKPNITKR